MSPSTAVPHFSPCAGSRWTLEILQRMDWRRFQEITTMLLARAGFQTEVAWVKPDGTVALYVTGKSRRTVTHSLVQCAAWTGYHVDGQGVAEFSRTLVAENLIRGIMITPGDVEAEARMLARRGGVEIIGGVEFLGTIGRMSPEEQAYYLRMATVGPWDVPTCPSCGHRMEKGLQSPIPKAEGAQRDLVFKDRTRRHIGQEINCRRLRVRAGADVLFLKPVRVEEMTVEGSVMGNLVCTEKLTIVAGGIVSGLVAARNIRLEPGGRLEAEARILNTEEIHPVGVQPRPEAWFCPDMRRCRAVLPLRQ
ncbi:MAG: restriction endonuclease [Verrucomicrobiales bacterium]|nr:restriction endonuclease [Verrucomicrobiales bacterium]